MQEENKAQCGCMENPRPPLPEVRWIGKDETEARCGQVSLRRCDACGRYWLLYQVEYPSYTQSGRWFVGLIDAERAETLAPEEAVPHLASLDWYFRGGAYFFGEITKVSGPVSVDL